MTNHQIYVFVAVMMLVAAAVWAASPTPAKIIVVPTLAIGALLAWKASRP